MAGRRCSPASAGGRFCGFSSFFPKYQLAWALLAQSWWENCSKRFGRQWSKTFWPPWVTHANAPFDMWSVSPAVDPPLALSVRLSYCCQVHGSRQLTSLRSGRCWSPAIQKKEIKTTSILPTPWTWSAHRSTKGHRTWWPPPHGRRPPFFPGCSSPRASKRSRAHSYWT